jgi:hypothetical protein
MSSAQHRHLSSDPWRLRDAPNAWALVEECGPEWRSTGRLQARVSRLPVPVALSSAVVARLEQAARAFRLENSALKEIERRIDALEASSVLGCVTLTISTFAPESYVVMKPIPIFVQSRMGGFEASFADANINASGDTQQEAYANVRELILDTLDSLTSLSESKLGPEPIRQLAVLREFIDVSADH